MRILKQAAFLGLVIAVSVVSQKAQTARDEAKAGGDDILLVAARAREDTEGPGSRYFSSRNSREYFPGLNRESRVQPSGDAEPDQPGAATWSAQIPGLPPDCSLLNPDDIAQVDNRLYFTAATREHGAELWVADTESKTARLLKDIAPGAEGSGPQNLIEVDGQIYFAADDGTAGRELWRSDGTPEGTGIFQDLVPGPDGAEPTALTRLQNTLYFAAPATPASGRAPRTAETPDGEPLAPALRAANPRLLASLHDPLAPRVLWQTDGTPEGTAPVQLDTAPQNTTLASLLPEGSCRLLGATVDPNPLQIASADAATERRAAVPPLPPGPETPPAIVEDLLESTGSARDTEVASASAPSAAPEPTPTRKPAPVEIIKPSEPTPPKTTRTPDVAKPAKPAETAAPKPAEPTAPKPEEVPVKEATRVKQEAAQPLPTATPALPPPPAELPHKTTPDLKTPESSLTIAAADTPQRNNTTSPGSLFVITFDSVSPSVSLHSPATDPTSQAPIPLRITFSEPVLGFSAGDIEVVNGSVRNFSGSGAEYTADIVPVDPGPLSALVPADAVRDAAGNGNSTSPRFTRTFDDAAPSVLISSPISSPTTGSLPVEIHFSEFVAGFSASRVEVTNAEIRDFSGTGNTYTFQLVPLEQGLVTVDVPPDVAVDNAGNGNRAADQFARVYDDLAPTATLKPTVPEPTSLAPIPIVVVFSEPIQGFTAEDLQVVNGVVQDFKGSGNSYGFSVAPGLPGQITIELPGNVVFDAAGNGNSAAPPLRVTYDDSTPSVDVSSKSTGVTGEKPIPVTIAFSEPVRGFSDADIQATNATVFGFSGSGARYSLKLEPLGQGRITLDIPAGVADDYAGNQNSAAPQLEWVYDSVPPTVSMAADVNSRTTSRSSVRITVTFSEEVTGFTVSDITVSNGRIEYFKEVDRSVYTFDLSPLGQGQVTANIPPGVAHDAAGNGNLALGESNAP